MTPKRQAVLDAVITVPTHPSAEEIFREVQQSVPGIGVATVYRTLDLLVRSGRLTPLRLAGESVTRYDANLTPHQHVICDECGAVFDVDLELPDDLVAEASERSGVRISQYDLRLRGTCADCRG